MVFDYITLVLHSGTLICNSARKVKPTATLKSSQADTGAASGMDASDIIFAIGQIVEP